MADNTIGDKGFGSYESSYPAVFDKSRWAGWASFNNTTWHQEGLSDFFQKFSHLDAAQYKSLFPHAPPPPKEAELG